VQAQGRLELWKIALKPGRPLAFGTLRRGAGSTARFIGLPGNPVSSFVTFLLFVRPFVLKSQGARAWTAQAYRMRADFEWTEPDVRREFLRARVNEYGGLELFPNQSSGVLTSTVWGDGLVDNPPGQPIRRGDLVQFLPFAELLS
jgi:molybdopterin molybdotransferase